MVNVIFVKGRSQTLLYSRKWDRHSQARSENFLTQTSCLLQETGRSQARNIETQKQTIRIKIHQSQITNHDLLRGPAPKKRPMISG